MRAARASGRSRAPACARSAATNASASATVVTARSHVCTPASSGEIVRRPEAGVLEDPVGQRGVVEGLDAEGQDADVGAEDQPRRLLVVAAAEPDEVRRACDTRRSRRRPCTRPRATRRRAAARARASARRPRAAAPSPCASRGGRARRRRPRCPDRARGTSRRRGRRAAPRGRPRARARRACRRRRTSAPSAPRPARAAPRAARASTARRRRPPRSGPSARTRARPAVAARAARCASGHCTGWKIATARRSPPSARSSRRAVPRGEPVAQRRRQPRDRAVGDARRIGGDDAVGAQQVARLVGEDEPLQRSRAEQQEGAGRDPARADSSVAPSAQPLHAPAGRRRGVPGVEHRCRRCWRSSRCRSTRAR